MLKAGLTLIELLVTLAIAAIVVMTGIPAFRELVLDQRMTAQINGLVHGIFLAKQTAHTRTTETILCPSASGRRCEPDADWSGGWTLFADSARAGPSGEARAGTPLAVGDAYRGGSIRANRRAFVFRAFEIRSTNGTFVFCDDRGAEHARALVVSYTGRPRIARTRPDGTALQCPS